MTAILSAPKTEDTGESEGHQRQIQLPLQDIPVVHDASVFHHIDFDFRISAVKLLHDGRKEQGRAGGRDAELDALIRLPQKLHTVHKGIHLLQQKIGFPQETVFPLLVRMSPLFRA